MALRAAKEKAEKMAGALDQLVGAPVQISEDYSASYSSYYSGWGYGRIQGMPQTANVIQDSRSGSGDISDSIALGKIAIKAIVNVAFELKEKGEKPLRAEIKN